MTEINSDLTGRRVVVPGGTGAVGEGVVRHYLAAGAEVVVPTRTQARADEFREVLGTQASAHLHLVVHDYTTFAAAESLAAQVELKLGGIDDVVAPVGGWWAGKSLSQIDETDWQKAFVGLASAHMALLRAFLPRMTDIGAYTVIVGASASIPIPGSGLVSMEQAAIMMMQKVATAESQGRQRIFALVLGPVNTRPVETGGSEWVTADQVGAVAVAVSGTQVPGREIHLRSRVEADHELAALVAF